MMIFGILLLAIVIVQWAIEPKPLRADKVKQKRQLIITSIATVALVALAGFEFLYGEMENAWGWIVICALGTMAFTKQITDFRTRPAS